MNVYTFNNLNSRQRSQTLQPDKDFMIRKYFISQSPFGIDRTNYANVSHPATAAQSMNHPQNYYHQANNYYNLSSSRNVIPTPQTSSDSNNNLRLLEVLNELCPIDEAPQMPSKRNYVICGSLQTGLFKVPRCTGSSSQ